MAISPELAYQAEILQERLMRQRASLAELAIAFTAAGYPWFAPGKLYPSVFRAIGNHLLDQADRVVLDNDLCDHLWRSLEKVGHYYATHRTALDSLNGGAR